MGVIGKQRDQGEEQGGKNRDPALTVKSQNHRSQPKPLTQDSTGKLSGHPWNHVPGGRPDPRPRSAARAAAARLSARCLNPKGSKGNDPASSALLGGVRKSVQAVQILDAFRSASAGGATGQARRDAGAAARDPCRTRTSNACRSGPAGPSHRWQHPAALG